MRHLKGLGCRLLHVMRKPSMDLYKKIAEHTQMKGFELSPEDIAGEIGELRAFGKYWVFDHIAHVPESRVLEFSTLRELEEYLISPSGPTNPFSTYAIPVIDGQVKEYRLVHGQGEETETFEKSKQSRSPSHARQDPRQWRIEWSDR